MGKRWHCRSLGAVAVVAAGVTLAGGPEIAEAAPINTATTSTTNHETHAPVDLPNAEAFSTRVAVVVDGLVVLDQTVADTPGSAVAQSAIGQAAEALAGACSVAGPFTASSDTVGPAVLVGSQFTGSTVSTTIENTFGPATILIGANQSITLFVPAGSLNTNTNTHTESFFDDNFQATVTHATDLVFTGQSCAAPYAVPDARSDPITVATVRGAATPVVATPQVAG